jgi:hypothetical protein
VSSPWLKNLKSLRLVHVEMGDEGALALAGATHLAGLKVDVSINHLTTIGRQAIRKAEHLTNEKS